MSEVDEQIARSNELLNRTSERYRSLSTRRRERQKQTLVSRLGRLAAADIAILLGAMVLGWFVPLGIGGAILVMLLLRSEEHTSELQSLMRTSYAGFCLQNTKSQTHTTWSAPHSHCRRT